MRDVVMGSCMRSEGPRCPPNQFCRRGPKPTVTILRVQQEHLYLGHLGRGFAEGYSAPGLPESQTAI